MSKELDLEVWRLVGCDNYEKFKQSIPNDYSPTTDWAIGGPLIEKRKIKIWPSVDDRFGWLAAVMVECRYEHQKTGETPLTAAIMALVASYK